VRLGLEVQQAIGRKWQQQQGSHLPPASRRLVVRVRDNGCGFGAEAICPDSNGLANMRKRLAAVNGGCVIQSRVGKGTNIRMTIPL
jgi:signal transduction histidine kinase